MPGDTVRLIEERVKEVEKRMLCAVIQNWHYAEAV
jgi:folate-dependent phosphoribosylglycinamide formyltransferase PurN